jgi:hypothetical protein
VKTIKENKLLIIISIYVGIIIGNGLVNDWYDIVITFLEIAAYLGLPISILFFFFIGFEYLFYDKTYTNRVLFK